MGVRARLTALGTIFILASIGIGVLFFAVEYPKQAALNGPGGRETAGRVLRLDTEHSGKYNGYFADIEYGDEQGRRHTIRAFYTMDDWSALHQSQTVRVKYLAAEPDYAVDPDSYKGRRDPRVMLIICSGMGLFGLALLVVPRLASR